VGAGLRQPVTVAGVSARPAVGRPLSRLRPDRPAAGLARSPPPRPAVARRLEGSAQARRRRQPPLLPLSGQRDPARRRAAADDDHRHLARRHRHHRQPAQRQARRKVAVAQARTVTDADRRRNRLRQSRRTQRPRAIDRCRSHALRRRRAVRRRCSRLLDLVPAAQRRLVARSSRTQSDHLGHRTGHRHAAAGACRLHRAVGDDGDRRQPVCHALRTASAVFRRPDARHRPPRLLARYLVLERVEPAPADGAGRPADRLRDARRAGLCLHPARSLARDDDLARDRPADCRRHVGRTHQAAGRRRESPPHFQDKAPR
jgi:hypothetical protein